MVIVLWEAKWGCRTVGCSAYCLCCWAGQWSQPLCRNRLWRAGTPQHTELARRNNRLPSSPASRHTTTTNTATIQSSAILWKSYCNGNEWFDVFSERFDIAAPLLIVSASPLRDENPNADPHHWGDWAHAHGADVTVRVADHCWR